MLLKKVHHDEQYVNDLGPDKMAICDVITNIFKCHGAVALKTPLLELEVCFINEISIIHHT